MRGQTYRSPGEGQDGIRLHCEVGRRQDRVGGGVEGWSAWVLEEVGVSIDEGVDACLVKASTVVSSAGVRLVDASPSAGPRGCQWVGIGEDGWEEKSCEGGEEMHFFFPLAF